MELIWNRNILQDWSGKQPQGPKGEPGQCTCNATALMTSFMMPKMIAGPKGEPGVIGKEGKQGQMGLTVQLTCFRSLLLL